METQSQFREGQCVDVLIYQPEKRRAEWESGFTVTGIVQAFDSKPYRVSVNDGQRFYADAAPECVRAAQAVTP